MTPRFYDTDSHLSVFEATVLKCLPAGDGFELILDGTAFFPGGGGQDPDLGSIDGQEVLALREEKGVVYHRVSKCIPDGTVVTGRIDAGHRRSDMQQHSGEHIISGLIHQTYGYDNVGFHMGTDEITLDINGVLSWEQLEEIERRANACVRDNLQVTVSYPPDEVLACLSYRSKKEVEGPVRIVTIGEIDRCACCAPHVSLTGEIGLIKLLSAKHYKGGMRISLLCGERALKTMEHYQNTLRSLTNLTTCSIDDLLPGMIKAREGKSQEHERLVLLSRRMIHLLAAQTPVGSEPYLVFESLEDPACAREYVQLLLRKRSGPVALFMQQDNPPQDALPSFKYIIASSTGSVRELTRQMNKALSGRGGGSDLMTQGAVKASRQEIQQFFTKAEIQS